MTRKPTFAPDDPEQSKRFIEIAKKAGSDQSKKSFEAAVKKVAAAKKKKGED
jgi:hypothetical protein